MNVEDKIKQFIADNAELYKLACEDTSPRPDNNGEKRLTKCKRYKNGKEQTGYDFSLHNKNYFIEDIEEAKAILASAGYEPSSDRAEYNSYKFINEELQSKYNSVNIENERIYNARVKISENALDFLFNSDFEKCFIRFGLIPENGKSYNFRDKFYEAGISAFSAVKVGDKYYVDVAGGMFTFWGYMESKTAYEVSGEALEGEKGSDGEPLLRNATIIAELNKDNIGGYRDFVADIMTQN